MTCFTQEVCTLSGFRDRIHEELISVARHPKDVLAILEVLQEAFREKINAERGESDGPFTAGQVEMWALIANLRADIAQEYGYTEEGK